MIPTPFLWRRVHSLFGFWLVLYLIEHLTVNSQAALWLGNDGHFFVRMVNFIQNLPFLHAIEIIFIGIPLLVHTIWGIKRIFTAEQNSTRLPYARNIAFTWQRLTSWILVVGIIAHVVQMRVVEAPIPVEINQEERFLIKLKFDPDLEALALRFHATLLPPEDIHHPFTLHENEVVIAAQDPGSAFLLIVRETFKSLWMKILYTIFVLAAAFHAFNGLWTFLITWGVLLSFPSQKSMIPVNMIGMAVLAFLGLLAIWG